MTGDPGLRAVAIAAPVAFLIGLDHGSLDGDPAVYAAIARRVAESGEWLTLRLGDEAYFNKPPLLFWLTALLFRVAGASTWTACFWSAAFGAAACVALYRLGRELFDRPTAFCAAWVLLGTYDFLSFSTRFRLESACALFLILALHEGLRATRRAHAGPLVRAGAWLGLCFAAKGGPGFIGIGALGLFLLWSGSARLLATRHAALGALVLLALALSWPLLQWQQHGAAYLERAIGEELIGRLTGDTGSSRSYAGVVLQRYWPWLPFLVLGAWRLAVRERHAQAEALRLLVCWTGVAFAALSLTAFPYGRYLSSVWPAFALLAGRWLAVWLGKARVARLHPVLPALTLAIAVAVTTLPLQVHRDRAAPARQLGALLDVAAPEQRDVVSYRESHPFWRGQLYFTLGRDLRRIDTPAALAADRARIVISRREAAAELAAAGWRPLLRGPRWTAFLRPPR